MPTRIARLTALFGLSVLLETILAFTASPAFGADHVATNKGKAALAESPPIVKDIVRAHVEILEWKLSPEELEAIRPLEGEDWLALATREDARTRVMYVFDSAVKVDERANFSSGLQVPLVRNATDSKDGQSKTTIRYQRVGCIVELRCNWSDETNKNEIEASFDLEMSDIIAEAPIAITKGVTTTPIFVSIEQKYATMAALGERQVFLRLVNQRVGKEQRVLAYLFSFRFDKIEKH